MIGSSCAWADFLLDRCVCLRQPLMLPQLLRPGRHQERFDIAIGLFNISDTPARRAVPALSPLTNKRHGSR